MNAAENESVTTLGAGPIRFLLASIFVVAGCAILYQLLIGTASSFFLGNSVQQFSLTIGVFLASIGLGAFLSRFVLDRMLERFILVELLLGLFGAESVPLLYLTYAIEPGQYTRVMLSLIVIIGALIGFELPLLTRIVESREAEGPFVDLDELQRVRGIGPKTLEKIRPYFRPLPPASDVAGQ